MVANISNGEKFKCSK